MKKKINNKNKQKDKKMNTVIQSLEPQLKIIDKKSNKHFGILLITQSSIEDFQIKSDMKKKFVSEYQFHYWALVARIKVNDEILDIAIPTVLFNYKQEVSQGSVKFHLKDVEEASNANLELANACANMLIKSDFCTYLLSIFPNIEWINVPMNTCHVHPDSYSSFSGTDYSKNIKDPGIVFPLANPLNQPSFSSILCHDTANQNIAKMVHTEYRNANKVGNDIIYEHGTCLAYIRDNRIIEYPLIQALFTQKQTDIIPSYINRDGTVVLENNDLLNNIIKEFDKMTYWNPYTTDIKAEKIIKKQNTIQPYGNIYGNKVNKNQTFSDYWDDDDDFMTLTDYRNEIVKSKMMTYQETYALSLKEAKQFYETFIVTNKQVEETYTNFVLDLSYQELHQELTDFGIKESVLLSMTLTSMQDKLIELLVKNHIEPEVCVQSNNIDIDEKNNLTPEDWIKYLLLNGFTSNDIKGKSLAELEFMFETIFEHEQDKIEKENTFTPHTFEFIN